MGAIAIPTDRLAVTVQPRQHSRCQVRRESPEVEAHFHPPTIGADSSNTRGAP
jgi:hypothetical protein